MRVRARRRYGGQTVRNSRSVLAEAGLLNGRRATVHLEYDELFRKRYPALQTSR